MASLLWQSLWHVTAGDDDWDIHRKADIDEDATAASAPLLGAEDGSPGGSGNTGIQVSVHISPRDLFCLLPNVCFQKG